MVHLDKIKREALDYVEVYVAHMKGIRVLHAKIISKKIWFFTFKVFS